MDTFKIVYVCSLIFFDSIIIGISHDANLNEIQITEFFSEW